MGIGYHDSIILYNHVAEGPAGEKKEYYYGTRFDGVRVELDQQNGTALTGDVNADSCIVKIPEELTGKYLTPKAWARLKREKRPEYFTLDRTGSHFFAIAKKKSLKIDVNLPVGEVDGSVYEGDFRRHIEAEYGYTYKLNTVRDYELIPRFEIGGN